MGAPVRAGHFELEVTGTRSEPCAGREHQAGPGHTYFFAEFRLRNIDLDDAITYGSFEWSLYGVGAKDSFPTPPLTCVDRPSPGPPHRGQTVDSNIAFEIPGDARLGSLVFFGGGGGPEVEFDVTGR